MIAVTFERLSNIGYFKGYKSEKLSRNFILLRLKTSNYFLDDSCFFKKKNRKYLKLVFTIKNVTLNTTKFKLK